MPRTGRPPLPRTKLRAHKVLVALTPGELAAIKRAAQGEPLAVFLRRVGLRAARRRG
jgi:hypothetical protein